MSTSFFLGNGIYGAIDFPSPDLRLPRREVSVMGHVFHADGLECDVKMRLNGEDIEDARWGLPRYDVHQECLVAPSYESGFVARFRLEGELPATHEISAIVTCGEHTVTIGPIRVEVDRLAVGDQFVPRIIVPAGAPGDYRIGGEGMVKMLIQKAGLERHHSVLEIGCGLGRGALALSRYLNNNTDYMGIDVLREVIEFCNSNITARYPNFRFYHLDVENGMYNPTADVSVAEAQLPVSSDSIDLVFLWSVFTHLRPKDVAAYLLEIARVLKPGTTVLASHFFMNERRQERMKQGKGLIFQPVEDFWTSAPDQPEQAICIDEDRVMAMYADAGLEVREVTYSTGEPVVGKQDIVVATLP